MATRNRNRAHLDYIASFSLPVRRKLRALRALIRKEAPGASEEIRYGVAAFLWNGPLVYIAGFQNHVSFFPTSSGIRAFKRELSGFRTSTGTIRFSLDEPLPERLLRRIVRFRLEELGAQMTRKSRCDRKSVESFDYSKLSQELTVLAKPAQRALIQAGLLSPVKIARKTEAELLQLHGLGPSTIPLLRRVLAARGLAFKTKG